MLRRPFILSEQKNVIRPLPCSSFPNHNRCAGLRFGPGTGKRLFRSCCSKPKNFIDKPMLSPYNMILVLYRCGCAGIGRLASLRCLCPYGRTGSTPVSRTNRRELHKVRDDFLYLYAKPSNRQSSVARFYLYPAVRDTAEGGRALTILIGAALSCRQSGGTRNGTDRVYMA